MHHPRLGLLLLVALLLAVLGGACGNSSAGTTFNAPQNDAAVLDASGGDDGSIASGDGPQLVNSDAYVGDDASSTLVISPATQTIDVNVGQNTPTVTYTAMASGQIVHASFAIDRAEIGSIDASTGVMTPTGFVGGTANVTATYGGQKATGTLTVRLHLVDNGAPASDAGTSSGGTGGNGGVGGNGAGGPVSSGNQSILQGNAGDAGIMVDPGLAWLYPYDQTVWPRGLLAPLLQWTQPMAAHNYDAVYIHLQENNFEYQGYFSANATPFVNTPIPQVAWQVLSNTNQGDPVTVTLVFSSGGQAYGPLIETWKIAQGRLTGTVYYNSYGTSLAQNDCCTINGASFGGATLAIKHGATSPVLVAGSSSECRVCHSVSADGSRLVTQWGSTYSTSSWYDLKNGYFQTTMNPQGSGLFAWPAMFPDGSMLMTDGAPLAGGTGGGNLAQLYNVATGATVPSTGIPAGLLAGSPVFSPDGTHVAFNFYGGTVNGTAADGVSLAAMDYAPKTSTFSNFRVLYTPASGAGTSVWPTFMPTNDAVVFELETVYNGRDWGGTRSQCDSSQACSSVGTQAELWWVDLATKTAARMDSLNGKGYLPKPTTDHMNDATLHYEPTVSPVPSGGYAWVVFTSRRLYGNVATINPWWSDPRYHDISTTPTTKKLWVAAIDLNAKAGTDPSHPAFYLPGQEILAGNSRGYWVVDPCQPNGTSCETGDQCCGGYCEDVDGGLVCSAQPPPCATLNDKCATSADCCGASQGVQCINGRCAESNPQ
jgi:hypothetical protein